MTRRRPEPPSGTGRVLVVEDDRHLADLIDEQLRLSGHTVTLARSLAGARERLAGTRFDLVLLDLNLPDGDGLELAEEATLGSTTQVLMLTARSDVESRVAGLYAGAADYLTKPFSVRELLARVHARLRQSRSHAALSYGPLRLEPRSFRCEVDGAVLQLPELEFGLLHLLLRYRGHVFSKEELERSLYGTEVPDSNTIEVFVYNLRRKLAGLGLREVIRTVRGRGYVVV